MHKKVRTCFGSSNTPDYTAANSSVAVCFADPNITHLFASLLEAKGVHSRVVNNLEQCGLETKIITEPMMLPMKLEKYRARLLVVGNMELEGDRKNGEDWNIVTLTRPLTEEKIEACLERFLG